LRLIAARRTEAEAEENTKQYNNNRTPTMTIFPSATPKKLRCYCLAAFVVALSVAPRNANAFTTPSSQSPVVITSSLVKAQSGRIRNPMFLEATIDDDDLEEINPIVEFARPLITAATAAFLATSLLFSNPLLPPPHAQAASVASASSQTATSIDIDLKSVPALTRKAIVNRDKLTNYLIESIKSFKPILDLLSEGDTVTVKPPADVKGAINRALTKGDAQFVVNGESVDIRVESVPGVIVVRVINPNIPRLPFLKDGTAALQFVDGIADAAPAAIERSAGEVQAIGKFLTWGAPQTAPIQYKGSPVDSFLSSKFRVNGGPVSLGALGDLTNSEVALLAVGTVVVGAYSASYGYYVSLQEEADQAAQDKKDKMAEKKKAKAAADAKVKADKKAAANEKEKANAASAAVAAEKAASNEKEKANAASAAVEAEKAAASAKAEPANDTASEASGEEDSPAEITEEEDAPASEEKPRARRRDAIKNIFRRGDKD